MKITIVKSNLLAKTLCAFCAAALALPLATQTARAQDASPAASAAATAAASPAKSSHFTGSVTAVDTTANTVTVASKKGGSKTFQVTDSAKFTGADGSDATLADIKKGAHVRIAYTTSDDGKLDLVTLKVATATKSK